MYYIVSAFDKACADENQILTKIVNGTPLFQDTRQDKSEIIRLNVDKTQFKIGSLDQLMQLNESAHKLDLQLDQICKKLEKVAFDTSPDANQSELRYYEHFNQSGGGMSYKDYIRNFKWNPLKYSTKRSLLELTALITKNMRQSDDQIRKNLEEQSTMKQKISQQTKKDGGNLQTRDYTDDIYMSNPQKDMFIEAHGSDLFINMLVVIHQDKVQTFMDKMEELMPDYYEFVDNAERRKIEDKARITLTQMRDSKDDKWDKLVAACGGTAPDSEEFETAAKAYLSEQMEAELKEKQNARFPYVIVPTALKALNVNDKDGNGVYRMVVYKDQADDVIKACRKLQISARTFQFNPEQWTEDKKNFEILKDTFQNKTNTLHKLSSDQFQEMFSALMHLKVIRAYIDGVLRFGIEPKFMIGVVIPKKGFEKKILIEMTEALAEEQLKEMYGEKIDASEADDYWPFVSIPLTSPQHIFNVL